MLQPDGKHPCASSVPSLDERPWRMAWSATHVAARKPERTDVSDTSSTNMYRIFRGLRTAVPGVGFEPVVDKPGSWGLDAQ